MPINVTYELQREINNRYDCNAIAVIDGCKLIAHVAKKGATKLAVLYNGGFVVSMTVKLMYDAETR